MKVTILLEELGVPYQLRHVDVFKGPGHTQEIVPISPFGKVPVIVDRSAGDLAVFESAAILTYLAETYGGTSLLPASGAERYAVLQWLAAQIAAVGPLLGQYNHFLLLPEEAESYAAGRYAEQARRIYRVLDDRLSAVSFLSGASYSIADIATWPWAGYVIRHGFAWADYPALRAWWDAIGARPAVKRAATASAAAFGAGDAAAISSASPAELDRFFWREKPGPQPDFESYAKRAG